MRWTSIDRRAHATGVVGLAVDAARTRARAAACALGVGVVLGCAWVSLAAAGDADAPIHHAEEVHLRNVRQLTFGGENAEAYWSSDGKKLIFQSTRDDLGCDQIFIMDADGSNTHMVSTGEGRTTCAYFFPAGTRILYASTHLAAAQCPEPPDFSRGYVWKLYTGFEIFSAARDGSDVVRLTDHPGYDAEATMAPDGSRILFTSLRAGDLDLYTMRPDGSDVRRITHELGYDGGGFFSADGKRIVWRASRPRDDKEKASYLALLAEDVIRPRQLELYVADADGGNVTQLTDNGAANFCPFFFPDGKRVVFASNVADPAGRNFDLYMVGTEGRNLEQITFDPTFDGFPMFSPDGRYIVFASNRNAQKRGDTNVFVAEWVD